MVPAWTACLESGNLRKRELEEELRELRNALVYADVVYWVPIGLFIGTVAFMQDRPEWATKTLARDADYAFRRHWEVQAELDAAGLSTVLTDFGLPPRDPRDVRNIGSRIISAMESAHLSIKAGVLDPNGPGHWDPYRATQHFTEALSRLFLPDLSELPFDAIAEMRVKLGQYLNPMRAELLRLTDRLRAAVHEQEHEPAVSREAEILIKTRVEPVVREAGQKAQDLLKAKWRRFFLGIGKVFGLTGAGLFFPHLLQDAVQEAIKTGAALGESEPSTVPPSGTAQFVLEARRFVATSKTRMAI